MNTSWKGSTKRNVDYETERKSWKVYADELLRGIKDRIFRNILLLSSMRACRGSRQGGSVASTNAIVTAGCKGARKFMVDRSANQPPNRQPNRQSSKKFHCRRIGITAATASSIVASPLLWPRASDSAPDSRAIFWSGRRDEARQLCSSTRLRSCVRTDIAI